MFLAEGGRPNDRRGFLHKSFIGRAVGTAVKTFVPAVGIASNLVSAVRGGRGGGGRSFGRGRGRSTVPRTETARVTAVSGQEKEFGKQLKFPDGGVQFSPFGPGVGACPQGMEWNVLRGRCETKTRAPCDFPMVRDSMGRCRTPTSGEFGGEQFGVGEAVMGRYGAALQPGSMIIDRAVCLKGMHLGNDGLCYNHGAITNKQRQWPRGRRPLLTGGDMRAIGIAARAGAKLDRTTKRLRTLGMMKALPKGRGNTRAHAHAKPVAAVSV